MRRFHNQRYQKRNVNQAATQSVRGSGQRDFQLTGVDQIKGTDVVSIGNVRVAGGEDGSLRESMESYPRAAVERLSRQVLHFSR